MRDVRLKDGRVVLVREFRVDDKEKLIEMYGSLSKEALRWAMPPYTREVIEKGWLSNLANLTVLVAFHAEAVVGHAQIYRFPHSRRKGIGDLVIYLHQEFQNVGLGAAMLTELIEQARKGRLHKIGLHVVADNKVAVHLYEKFGFKIEGVIRESYYGEDGRYHDQLAMGLILD